MGAPGLSKQYIISFNSFDFYQELQRKREDEGLHQLFEHIGIPSFMTLYIYTQWVAVLRFDTA